MAATATRAAAPALHGPGPSLGHSTPAQTENGEYDDWDEQAGRLEQVAMLDNLPGVLDSLAKWARQRAQQGLPTEVFFGSDAARLLLASYMRSAPDTDLDKQLVTALAAMLAADVGAGLDRASQTAAARLSMDGAG